MKEQERTSVYPVITSSVVPVVIKKVPDLESGGMRNRRYAAYLSSAIIKDLTDHSDPIIIQGDLPQLFIDGDTLDEVRDRMFEELRTIFKNAQDLVDGKVTMEDLNRQAEEEEKAFMEKMDDDNRSMVSSGSEPPKLKLVEDE